MKKSDVYPDLYPLISGISWNQLFAFIWIIASVRYATQPQTRRINPKFGTKNKLTRLCELEYLKRSDGGFYSIGCKTLELLKKEGYNTKILQTDTTANYNPHDETLTDFILTEMEKDDFYAVIYPHFKYKIPDCCLVWKRGDQYKLEMIELELSPKTNEFLDNKARGWEQAFQDIDIYKVWWKRWSRLLKLKYPSVDEFKFTVRYEKHSS